MFAKLLELLLHAKAGAISGVFLLGATGALVSVSASNGVTTIVLTDPSPTPTATASPSATASPTASPTATPTASPSATASPQPSSSPDSPVAPTAACVDEAKALAFQVERVDSAYQGFHTDLMKLRSERDRATVKTADSLLRQIRQAAVKAIHATATASCKTQDDKNGSETDDQKGQPGDLKGEHEDSSVAQSTATTLGSTVESTNVELNDDKGTTNLGITFTGDAASIADQAITAMQTAFDTAKNAPAVTPKPESTKKPESTQGPKVTTTKGPQQSGRRHD